MNTDLFIPQFKKALYYHILDVPSADVASSTFFRAVIVDVGYGICIKMQLIDNYIVVSNINSNRRFTWRYIYKEKQ